MKKFFLALVFFNMVMQAQSIKVVYSEKEMISQKRLDAMPPDVKNAKLAEMKVSKLYTLEGSDGISLYQKDKSTKDFEYENKESKAIDENSILESTIIVNKKNTTFFYYKEMNNDLMLFKLTNGGIDFDGKDKLISWNWEITNETKVISGYNCKKAVSRAFNAYFSAWFTEDIPVNAGAVEFTAEKIEVSNEKISLAQPKIPETTVTFFEMIDIVTKKFNQVKNSKPIKQGNTTITTETY